MKSQRATAKAVRQTLLGACLTSGLLCVAVSPSAASARDFFGFSGGYYPRSYFSSARPPASVYRDEYESPRVDRLKAQTAEKLKKAPVPPPTKGPLMVVVSIAKQQLTVYDEGNPFLRSKVSTGSRGHETPTGVFAVIQKSRWHRSNLYSDAPMPFMQRITWSGVALHAGQLPGYPASHGCIRMPEDFAIRMWRTTQMGARVIVAQNDVYPAEIAHPVLFVHKAAQPIVPPMASSALGLRSTVEMQKTADATSGTVASVGTQPTATSDIKVAEIAIVRPGQSSTALIANDQAAAATATAIDKDSTGGTARETPVAREGTVSASSPAAAPQPTAPSTVAQNSTPPAPPALTPSQPSPVMPQVAPSLAPERNLRAGAISVLISRKERKLFVRKGFAPVFDAPVTIKDADQVIGTHVFTALAQENGSDAFRWNVVTVPNAVRGDRRAETPIHYAARKKVEEKPTAIDAPPPPSTEAAKAALDRIELPADAVERISALMSVGASLIVTDEGLGPETGQETDFVVLTKDGPQAPPATKKPRRRNYDYED